MTPKVHAVYHHVIDFCENQQMGLGSYSEQASESVHSDFGVTWKNYKVGVDHEQFPIKLCKSVCFYNTLHM